MNEHTVNSAHERIYDRFQHSVNTILSHNFRSSLSDVTSLGQLSVSTVEHVNPVNWQLRVVR